MARDLVLFGSPEEVRRRYLGRYLPGQALYRAEAAPEDAAHVVIDSRVHSSPGRMARAAPPIWRQAWPAGMVGQAVSNRHSAARRAGARANGRWLVSGVSAEGFASHRGGLVVTGGVTAHRTPGSSE
jgi:hypothetical protein